MAKGYNRLERLVLEFGLVKISGLENLVVHGRVNGPNGSMHLWVAKKRLITLSEIRKEVLVSQHRIRACGTRYKEKA